MAGRPGLRPEMHYGGWLRFSNEVGEFTARQGRLDV